MDLWFASILHGPFSVVVIIETFVSMKHDFFNGEAFNRDELIQICKRRDHSGQSIVG